MEEVVMTENEKKKEYLSKYIKLGKQEKKLDEEIREIQLNKRHPSFSADGMPKGNGKTDLSSYAVLLDEKERQRDKVISQKNICYANSKARISLLANEDEKQVLVARYHFGLGWTSIANGMNKGVRRVLQIHGQALKNFRLEES